MFSPEGASITLHYTTINNLQSALPVHLLGWQCFEWDPLEKDKRCRPNSHGSIEIARLVRHSIRSLLPLYRIEGCCVRLARTVSPCRWSARPAITALIDTFSVVSNSCFWCWLFAVKWWVWKWIKRAHLCWRSVRSLLDQNFICLTTTFFLLPITMIFQ